MGRADWHKIYQWVTAAVIRNPGSLSSELSKKFHVSRATAASILRKLTEEGWIVRNGSTRPVYSLGRKRRISNVYALPGVDEQRAWEQDFQPFFSLKPNVENICHHGFTEILNNANDHSAGRSVYVAMRQDETSVSILISDDGIGIFEKITSALSLPDKRLALLELSKGKLTTSPHQHSGEGIFFTSRMFSHFVIVANELYYTHDASKKHDWLFEGEAGLRQGTAVDMSIELDSVRTTKEVFDDFSGEAGDFSFNKTVVPVRLAILGNENLISRSQAKRLIQRFENFVTVILDFEGIPEIGQAFSDEVFRVFANNHPEVTLVAVNTIPDVEAMIKRVRQS
ncbi:MAG: DUF4325 domain-containing protein [Burkholderiaceae bacterium]|jgi:hypothetical protein|nr:DUF4325 domain-containing protein [Burkholderiaceae bacterium]